MGQREDMQVFVRIVKAGSITKAARRLDIEWGHIDRVTKATMWVAITRACSLA